MQALQHTACRLSSLLHRTLLKSMPHELQLRCQAYDNTNKKTNDAEGRIAKYLVAVEVRTLPMGAMNAEAVPTRARATQTDFMVDVLGVV